MKCSPIMVKERCLIRSLFMELNFLATEMTSLLSFACPVTDGA